MSNQEIFNNMITDYYQENTDFDFYNEEDVVDIIADFFESCSSFVLSLVREHYLEDDDDAVYRLTPLGIKCAEQIRREKVQRHDDLMDKYYNFSITKEELDELKSLKEVLE